MASAGTSARHVALILDGNRRWARVKGLPTALGHAAGARRVRDILQAAVSAGLPHLTLFAFSTENWKRSTHEVAFLMSLFRRYLARATHLLVRQGIALKVIGDVRGLAPELVKLIQDAERVTAGLTRLNLRVAVNYGGRWDLVQACQRWHDDQLTLSGARLSEPGVDAYLSTAGTPDVDLLIRTGGEHRISNFLLWQSAYAELLFLPQPWPDFSADDFVQALKWYAHRHRRGGGD